MLFRRQVLLEGMKVWQLPTDRVEQNAHSWPRCTSNLLKTTANQQEMAMCGFYLRTRV
jgi:hypothetical protein